MKLFLCSSFITLETQKDFEALVKRPMKNLKLACITTASKGYISLAQEKGEKIDLSWLEDDIKLARETFGCVVDIFDIEVMSKEQMKETFKNYDVIWMEGGMVIYLMNAIINSGFKPILDELIKDKVYIGSSAGSMVCSKSLDATEWYIGDPEENPNHLEGLGYVDFQIYPHFNPNDLDSIKNARHTDQEYFLLKNGQAVAVEDRVLKMCGGGVVKLERQL